MSDGEHQWFCDVAAQVARAELHAARIAGGSDSQSDMCSTFAASYDDGQARDVDEVVRRPPSQQIHMYSEPHNAYERGHVHAQGHGPYTHVARLTDDSDWNHQDRNMDGGMQWVGGHSMQAHGGPPMGSMMRSGATGLGGVEYTHMSAVNNGSQHGWLGSNSHGFKQEDHMQHGMPSGGNSMSQGGDEDGSSNILKMMFGLAL